MQEEQDQNQEAEPQGRYVISIERLIDTTTGEDLPTDKFEEKILDIIGQVPSEDIEYFEDTKMNIAHNKKLGYDVWYSVGIG